MQTCESKMGKVCGQPATWKQAVHAAKTGKMETGRFMFNSYWCDEHADKITQKRKLDRDAPPTMSRIAEPTTPS